MIYLLIIPTVIGLILFTTMAIVEDYLIPKLKPTSNFRKWWRSNIIGASWEDL